MAKIFGIELAPLRIPMDRRLQTFWVATYLNLVLPFMCFSIVILTLLTRLWFLMVIYLTWVVYDYKINKSHNTGIYYSSNFRTYFLFRHFSRYFPCKLIKTAELDPWKNYLLCVHPHGIISCGAYGNFASDTTGFSELFPGMRSYMLTLTSHFQVPLSREILLRQGMCDASKETIEYLLNKSGKGNAVVLIVGGAEEALDAKPGQYKITVHKRKGFVRLALQSGTPLVPVFSFGEVELFKQINNPPGSFLRTVQTKFKKLIGLSPPLFYARGIFNYNFGILPYRKPVYSVVGAPIELEKIEKPSKEDIDKYHKLYLEKLTELFETHKLTYGVSEETKLEFI